MSTTTLPAAQTEPELLIREHSGNQLLTRVQIDRSCRRTVVMYYGSAVFWLVMGSIFAMITSIKMHNPGFLGSWQWLTFGRVRPVHLNLVSYGWASMASVGTLLWLQARLFRVRLPYRTLLPVTLRFQHRMAGVSTAGARGFCIHLSDTACHVFQNVSGPPGGTYLCFFLVSVCRGHMVPHPVLNCCPDHAVRFHYGRG
jgi:hypothetical protein